MFRFQELLCALQQGAEERMGRAMSQQSMRLSTQLIPLLLRSVAPVKDLIRFRRQPSWSTSCLLVAQELLVFRCYFINCRDCGIIRLHCTE